MGTSEENVDEPLLNLGAFPRNSASDSTALCSSVALILHEGIHTAASDDLHWNVTPWYCIPEESSTSGLLVDGSVPDKPRIPAPDVHGILVPPFILAGQPLSAPSTYIHHLTDEIKETSMASGPMASIDHSLPSST